jgi:hypothetical protein
MPKLVLPLSDIQLRNAKPKDKSYKLADGGGLYLEVMPNGSKLWRMKFKQATGNESRLAFGAYPEVSLLAARKKRAAAREQLAGGVDPAQAKRIDKQNRAKANANTFEAVAREWHANKVDSWQERTATNVLHRLERDVFPLIGRHPIADIRAPVMLDVLRQIER